ncbi:MAG: PKD domain-containing protein [Acidobacteria bacterium]|jgi:PKD repeat protein|nr:PKD domain-containing protein [Acidobacteriota bacterium]
MLRRPLAACSLLLLAILIPCTSTVAAERLPARWVPGDAAVSPAAADQSAPSLAAGGGMVLALWSDNRANSTGGYEGETSRDIYAMRFDGNGAPLDAVPFAVTAARASQEFPRAAFNGTNWLVVFESYDLTGTGYYYQKSLAAVRVAPDGSVLDPVPIRILNVSPVGATWAVASDGRDWVVAMQGSATGGDLTAARISAAGVLLDPNPRILVAETYYLRGALRLAFAGGVYLMTFDEAMTGSSETSALRFDATLTPLDPAPVTLLPHPIGMLASNGSGFYAVWTEQLPDYSVAVLGTRIDTAGHALDGTGVNISGLNAPVAYTSTSVAWDGANWKASWGAAGGTRLARISSGGQVLDPGGVAVPGPQTGPTASVGNGSLQLAWTVFAASTNDVVTANVSSSNVAGPNRTASTGAPAQSQPDLATGSNGFMVAYRSMTSARHRILAQPLDAAGNPLTAEPTELDAGDPLSLRGAPAVAWNGSTYLVAWPGPNGVMARRVRPDGSLADAAPAIVLASSFGAVDTEALGGDFLVIGLRCGYTCQYINPVAARVRGSDGALLDPSPIGLYGTYSSSPRLTVLGGRWLAAWQDNWSHDDPGASTAGAFIDAAGAASNSFSIHGPYSTAGGNGIFTLGLASNGSVALLVQSQELTSGVENDLLGVFVRPDGTVAPYFNITPWAGNQYRPQVAWDGSRFVVVFQDQKARVTRWSLEQLDARSDLFGMRITPSGAILDPQGFVFSNSAAAEAFPSVTATADGRTLIAAAVVRNEPPLVNYRIGYELFGAGGNAWPVAVASAAPAGGDVPLGVSFSSAGSGDLDGTLASYAWDFGDGGTATEPNPTHVYAAGGPFLATLTVADTAGARTTQEVLIDARTPNVAPVAHASSNIASGQAPLDVVFSATGSYDPDGWLGNIRWTFGDGSESWGATAYHTFYDAGTFHVTLTVYDGSDATGTDTLTVTVSAETPPAAPSNLVATAASTTQVNLTWKDNSDNERDFYIERCTGTAAVCNASPELFSFLDWPAANATAYSDYMVSPNTTYSYRIKARGVTVDSGWSNTAQVTTSVGRPAAPTQLTATSSLKFMRAVVDLRWKDNSGNETGFVVERCKGSGCTNFAVVAQPAANAVSWRDNGVARRAIYRYRVKARNGAGDSTYSNVATAMTP